MTAMLGTIAAVCCLAVGGAVAAPVYGQGTWETTLQARDLDGNASNGPEAFYDTTLKITWLANALSFSGTWPDTINAAANFNLGGVTGWRLPTLFNVPDSCQWSPIVDSSEWRQMFFVTLGNGKSCSTGALSALVNTGPFVDLISGPYWSGTENPNISTAALDFFTYFGQGSSHDKTENMLAAWFVHDGDVSSIPEPQTLPLALLSISIAGLALRRRLR